MFVDTIRRKLTGRRLVRGVLLVTAGNVLGTVVLFAATPAITRLYAPADFGVLGIYASLLALLGVFATLRYEGAIALPKDHVASANLLALCVGLSVVMAAAIAVTFWILGDALRSMRWMSSLLPYTAIFALNVVVFGIHQGYMFWAVRQGAFAQLAWLRLANCLATVGIQIGLGLCAAGAFGLIMGSFLSFCCAAVFLGFILIQEPSLLRSVTLAEVRGAASRYRHFAVYSTSATFMARLNAQLPPVVFVMMYSLEVAGWYALAQRIVANPLSMLVNPVARVYCGEAARIHREHLGGLDKLFAKTVRRVVTFAVLPTAVAIVGVPLMFSWIFGAAWREAGIYCWILAPMILIQMVADAIAPTLEVLEKQRAGLLTTLAVSALTISSVATCWHLVSPARAMLAGLAFSSAMGSCLTIWQSWYFVRETQQGRLQAVVEPSVTFRRAA